MVRQNCVRQKGNVAKPVLSICAVLVALSLPVVSTAAPLSEVFTALMAKAPRSMAAQSDLSASEERVSEITRRAWAPQLEVNLSGGAQRYEKPNAAIHDVGNAFSRSVRLTQLISDFGRSSNSIEENRMVNEQSKTALEAMKQGVALDAFMAYLSVQRSAKVLDFARLSERNIMEQTKIEDALVEAGKGYVSNVLQAKAQLAGAQARRVRAEGADSVARYRVKAVFSDLANGLVYDQIIASPTGLPATLQKAIDEAVANSLQIKLGSQRTFALTARKGAVTSREFLPRLQFILESRTTSDFDGVMGSIKDDRAQIQLNYPINLGFSGKSAINSANDDISASVQREMETQNLVLEQVSISWRNLETARDNRANLTNQVRLANQFLSIAREERAVGKRSLLDVLSAETNLINAQSDLASTEFDVLSAGFTLLQSMGRLDVQSVQTALKTSAK